MKHKTLIFLLTFLLVYILAACLPYLHPPGVSEETAARSEAENIAYAGAVQERAAILTTNEEALAERIRLISSAQDSLILSTFDFKADNSGKIMLAALSEAAEKGVRIDLLVDGFSYLLHMRQNPFFYSLTALDNVTLKVYNPVNLLLPHRLMARMHDKYLLADDSVYILGGRNTYDYFLGGDTGYKNYDWDALIYCPVPFSGSSVEQLNAYFQSVWTLDACHTAMDSVPFFLEKKVQKCRESLAQLLEEQKELHPDWFEKADYEQMTVPASSVRLLSNPVQPSVKEPVLFYQMTELMRCSDEPIVFHTPYILCDDEMLDRLSRLCAPGRSVTMMTNSVANNGNPFGASDYRTHKQELLDTGLSILEYDSGVSYHGKCFVMGDTISGVGSFNWDMRSVYLDTELMLVIDSRPFCDSLKEAMGTYEKDALTVCTADTWTLREGQSPQKLSFRKSLRILLITPFLKLFRFLM